jgi:uncharacterized protein with von Willebrand factor type A (vWA) domain
MKSYRYSGWDGSQDPFAVDADDLMDAMSDELMSHGDLQRALQNLMRRGMQGRMGSGFEGIRELAERLKQQSRERLERYNLASLIDELKERLQDILRMEREALAVPQASRIRRRRQKAVSRMPIRQHLQPSKVNGVDKVSTVRRAGKARRVSVVYRVQAMPVIANSASSFSMLFRRILLGRLRR